MTAAEIISELKIQYVFDTMVQVLKIAHGACQNQPEHVATMEAITSM